MPKKKPLSRKQAFDRPSNALKALENRAVGVRKLLRKREPASSGAWGVWNDALQIAETVEQVASHAQQSSAEDAMAAVQLLEMLCDLLDERVRDILTF